MRKTGGTSDQDQIELPAALSDLCQECFDGLQVELQIRNIVEYPDQEKERLERAAQVLGGPNYVREGSRQNLKAIGLMQRNQGQEWAGDSFSVLESAKRDAANAERNSATYTIASSAVDSPSKRRSTTDNRTITYKQESTDIPQASSSGASSSGRPNLTEEERVEARRRRFTEDRTLSPASVATHTAASQEHAKRPRAGIGAIFSSALRGANIIPGGSRQPDTDQVDV